MSNTDRVERCQTLSFFFDAVLPLIDSLEMADLSEWLDRDDRPDFEDSEPSLMPSPTGFVVCRKSITNFNSRMSASPGVICSKEGALSQKLK